MLRERCAGWLSAVRLKNGLRVGLRSARPGEAGGATRLRVDGCPVLALGLDLLVGRRDLGTLGRLKERKDRAAGRAGRVGRVASALQCRVPHRAGGGARRCGAVCPLTSSSARLRVWDVGDWGHHNWCQSIIATWTIACPLTSSSVRLRVWDFGSCSSQNCGDRITWPAAGAVRPGRIRFVAPHR